ncbi:MAG: UTP--glucose-1-phosphate uridylyltransferase [Chloroflexi bacterium]|nr:UTP--glucose-1-phosphate uridylyltransferase [Chloroflexota bacterium]
MNIRKAVITAASPSQRNLPLQTLVDRDGKQKSALCVIIEEARSAGIEEIGIVTCPGDENTYMAAANCHATRLHFIEQPIPLGYGYGVYSAREFVGDEPFLHLVSDHLYISHEHTNGTSTRTCAQQLIEVAQTESCAVSAVQATRESMLPFYGTVGGRRVAGQPNVYTVENVIEKPTPTEAEQQLIVPGLRAGFYLCFFGMHVLTPTVMNILAEHVTRSGGRGPIQLSPALAELAAVERYLAFEVQGQRYDIGVHYGLLTAQLALALSGRDREEVLAQMVDLLAARSLVSGQ